MAENRVEANAHNAGGCPASNAIHGHINDFLVRTGLRSGVSELQLPCFTAVRAEIALMSGSAFAVTHHAFSSGAGRTSDGNGSHASTLKSPSYTKSVSWQHHPEMCRFHKMPAVLQNNSNSAFTFMLPVLLKRQHPVRRDAKTFPEHADKIRCAYITTLRGHPVDRQTGL